MYVTIEIKYNMTLEIAVSIIVYEYVIYKFLLR